MTEKVDHRVIWWDRNNVLVFTYIFAAEAFLKILALGFITYLKDPWNTFDFVIVIISISDVFISLTSPMDENQSSGLNVLRTLRVVLRVSETF